MKPIKELQKSNFKIVKDLKLKSNNNIETDIQSNNAIDAKYNDLLQKNKVELPKIESLNKPKELQKLDLGDNEQLIAARNSHRLEWSQKYAEAKQNLEKCRGLIEKLNNERPETLAIEAATSTELIDTLTTLVGTGGIATTVASQSGLFALPPIVPVLIMGALFYAVRHYQEKATKAQSSLEKVAEKYNNLAEKEHETRKELFTAQSQKLQLERDHADKELKRLTDLAEEGRKKIGEFYDDL